jgi:hypothetical protein
MHKNGEEPHNSEVRFEKYALSFTCSVSWITSHVLPRSVLPDREINPTRDGNFGDRTFVGPVECAENRYLAGGLIHPGRKIKIGVWVHENS